MKHPIYCLFHRHCSDGAGARFAAWLRFKDDATYIDVQYNEPLPEIPDNSNVYILDFSYDRQTLIDLRARVNHLVVLDHHDTAKKDLEGLDFAQFDENECGATMAWKYFHGDVTMPEMFQTIRDYDMWKFEKPWTPEISAAWVKYRDNNEAWQEVCQPSNSFTDLLISAGQAILDEHRVLLDEMIKQAIVVSCWGARIAVVNTSTLVNQANDRMQKDPKLNPDCTMTYYIRPDGKVKLSLRSAGKVNVAKIARTLDPRSGGRETTAGAVVDMTTLLDLLSKPRLL